ncbi:HAD family hydrolase [Methanobrevibacter sp. OttesenSCG-928-K11]|nr:HAD family hydrolase [Methanobrevibacter sp. OttesenSCG-928-K11]MDL2270457.1 HAD family hydrolase [Methanobrevibacter sp. OttesenSCG-928-I08]
MIKKAIVFDNSGTLLERYRVIKDLSTGKFLTEANSLEIIDELENSGLVVFQFNTTCLKKLDPNIRLYDLIKDHDIKFDISYHNANLSDKDVLRILEKDKATIKDITDGFEVLKDKVRNMELCNGSAIILDAKKDIVAYTITSAGHLFPNTKKTINILKSRGIDIFIASGDRSGAIEKLTEVLDIEKDHGFPTASTEGKETIINNLQSKGYKVMMVGDGINDVLAFKASDISVLTLEQHEEVNKKLLNTTDFTIHDILEVTEIDF